MASSKSTNFDPLGVFPTLEERLTKGNLPRAIFFAAPAKGGFEPFFADRAITLWKDRVAKEKGLDLFLHDPQDAERFRLGALCDDLQTAPLFGGAKAVLVRRADSLCRNARSAGGDPEPFEVAVLRFLEEKGPNAKALLFVTFETLNPNAPLLAEAARRGAMVFESRKLFASPPPWADYGGLTELERWIGLRARAKKLSLSAGATSQLAQHCGADLGAVEKELDAVARGEKTLEPSPASSPAGKDNVAKVVPEATPRALLQPWLRGDLPRALAVLDQMFREGLVTWDGDRVQARAIFPILSAALFSELRDKPVTPALRRAWDGLLALEREVKGGRAPEPRVAIERFLISCVPVKAAPAKFAGASARR